MTFFKNDSPDIRANIAADFDKMASECQGRFDSSNTTVTCAQDQNQCQPGTSAVTTSYGRPDDQVASNLPKPEIRLCDQFFGLNPDSAGNAKAKSAVFGRQSGSQPACGSHSPGVMLHEMSHAVIGTTDMIKANGEGSYGLADVASLSPEQNLNHADTYALFAHAAALGCSQDDLRSGRTPRAGVPTSLYGNDGTSSDTQSDPTTPQQGTGGSDGRGPRRNTTTPPPKTRTRGPTMGTRGPGPRIPQEQPPQNASPEETQPPSQDTQDPAQETQVLAEGKAVSQPDSQDPAQETQVLAEGNAVSQPDIQDPTQETQVLAEGNAVSQPEAASAPAPSAEQSEPLDPYSSSALEQGGQDF
ncbi:Metallopeptidase, catalytic domain protein [Ophiocordyceps sinensis CO18]|uniref:Metallopeptidase, catalytic domain protein n=1 Tax=Ophiocordyceps sinensis (strain Co18 / CGMCC 3.14243) TaxID=911162 RepID=T5AA06_OPHSC|nr:Metallopeptidase, catalytic domain protein [Ophiocordyceps sinensis CO18]